VLGGFHFIELHTRERTLLLLNLVQQSIVPLAEKRSEKNEFSGDGLQIDLQESGASALRDMRVVEHEHVVINVPLMLPVTGTGGGFGKMGPAGFAKIPGNLSLVGTALIEAFTDNQSVLQTLG
jgi:hypothetical protein